MHSMCSECRLNITLFQVGWTNCNDESNFSAYVLGPFYFYPFACTNVLALQDQMLVVSERRSNTVPPLAKTAPSLQPPLGHFLVLPSPSPSSLLIKPLLVSELHLPSVSLGSSEEPSCDTMVSVEGSLEKVNVRCGGCEVWWV